MMEDPRMSRDCKDGFAPMKESQSVCGRFSPGGITARLAATRFAREALAEKADLKALRARPTPRVWVGLGIVGLSYIMGWPAVGLLAWISYHLGEPMIIVIGGPVTYGLSHLIFLAGSYLAGKHYAQIVLRWGTRCVIERLTGAARGSGLPASAPADLPPALVAGIAAFLLAGLLWVIRPVWAAIPLGCYILLCMVFPFFPQVGFFLPVIHRRETDCLRVALTFDDGPDPEVTPRLLELLRRQEVPATFFVAGARAERYPEVIREILSHGHALGNHSYHHDPLLMLRSRARLRAEVIRTQEALSAFAVRPLAFRPPVGITNSQLPGVLRELGLYCVTFSCRAFDRGNRRIARLSEIILGKVRPGDIILLHDVTPPRGQGIDLWFAETERIITGLKERGYRLLPLAELIDRPVMERLPAVEPPG